MDLHAVTLMSVVRIQTAVLRTAQTQREATIVPAALATAWPVMDVGAWVRQKMHSLNDITVSCQTPIIFRY